MSTKKIRGHLFTWGETGTEGLTWALQDENHVDANGMYDYDGLHVLRNGDHLKIYSPDGKNMLWEGTLRVLQYSHDRDPDIPLIFGGTCIHWLPDEVDLIFWFEVFKDRDKPYIGEISTYVSEED